MTAPSHRRRSSAPQARLSLAHIRLLAEAPSLKSAAKHGWTSLHHLHLAFEAAERYDVPTARKHLNASLELGKGSAQALRSLAVMVADTPSRLRLYAAAWEARARPYPPRIPPRSASNRASRPSSPSPCESTRKIRASLSQTPTRHGRSSVAASTSLTAFILRATRPLRATSSRSHAPRARSIAPTPTACSRSSNRIHMRIIRTAYGRSSPICGLAPST